MKETGNILLKEVNRRKRIRAVWINLAALTGAVALFMLLGFVNVTQRGKACHALDVEVVPLTPSPGDTARVFVTTDQVKKAVFAADSLIGMPLGQLPLAAIHASVEQLGAVREAHVYTTVDGRCVVRVIQHDPIARILNADGSGFYLDRDGFAFPLSHSYTAHVPVFVMQKPESCPTFNVLQPSDTAWAAASLADDVYAFTRFTMERPFLAAQTEHVRVTAQGEFEVIPRVGDHIINFGTLGGIESKYKKLMAFYAHEIRRENLNQYSVINLEYNGQIVCSQK